MNKPDAQRPRSALIVLVLGSIVAGLILLELGLRASTWVYLFNWPNFVLGARTVHTERDSGRHIHDARLGHTPRPNYAAPGLTIDADGLRLTGEPPASAAGTGGPILGGSILAVGDSFTFGEEVADDEAWPAQLQQLVGRRVLNAGVSGYGFDQIVLRAETLAATFAPSAIIVAFIADDIRRTEMRRLWGADKPYYDIEKETLTLRNVPVPPRAAPQATLNFWHRILGYSYLADFLMRRLDLLYDWYGDHLRVHPAGTGERIACLLTERLAELQRSGGARVLVVAEYDRVVWDDPAFAAEQRRLTEGLLACARQRGLDTIDSFAVMSRHAGDKGPRGLYVQWHMNAEGNRLIARAIAADLARPYIPPSR
ncbi:MAG: GDSL-type esterase/lipase family protein [Reyranella sp.]|nr:GDSL-type esterase/lipase family protein [Reyranella sp.]